ncbi:MAG: hypothetical protein IJY81_02225, partial [Lachnospiraceae bacterium]|nr:hypothetical protein [Lachnospiraceae bacterium]
MTNFYGIGSSGVNSLFSMGTSTSATSSTSMLSDYYSIKNGSYKKLLTAYYAKNGEKASISTSEDSSKNLVSMREAETDLYKTAGEIVKQGRNSVFAKDEAGKYDTDKIVDNVKKFVEDYNTLIEATQEANTSSIASNTSSIIRMTEANDCLLEKLGIKVNADFTLELDEKTLKEADMNIAKT